MGNFTITMSIGGDSADPDDVLEIFETAVRAVRAVGGQNIDGAVYAAGTDGTPAVQKAARDVIDLEAVDADEDADGDGDPGDELAGDPPTDAVTQP